MKGLFLNMKAETREQSKHQCLLPHRKLKSHKPNKVIEQAGSMGGGRHCEESLMGLTLYTALINQHRAVPREKDVQIMTQEMKFLVNTKSLSKKRHAAYHPVR